jgi:hypothetical protein
MQNDLLNATGKQNAVLDAALDGIAAGLSIWSSDFKLIHWNRRIITVKRTEVPGIGWVILHE